MIQGMVFSKDRALQLDGCLSSFARHVTDADSVRMVIVYAASSPRFLRQYQDLASEQAMRADFVLEQDFRKQVLGALQAGSPQVPAVGGWSPLSRIRRRRSTAQDGPSDCILFLVDDVLFVRPFALATAQEALHINPDALGFSLRLGRNTTGSYVLNRTQALPLFQDAGPKIRKFDWTNADGDFGYPLEISSSIYRLSTMSSLVRTLPFSDPNTLESQLSLRTKYFRRSHPSMLCPETSVVFGVPLNRVQEVYENRASDDPEWSIERLADRFDKGYRFDIDALDGFVPAACHQEIGLSFMERKTPNVGW
jgi:hypothetical protein